MTEFSWLTLLGGLVFFFFGLTYARGGLQMLAGDRLRLKIARMTRSRMRAFTLGALTTVMLQSSAACILMLISMASTGLITLTQGFGVILGADIGTTFVALLLSFKKITDYALLLMIAGFVAEKYFQTLKKVRYTGRVLLGFGFVFYGMKLMTETAGSLMADPAAIQIFSLLSYHPVGLLLSALLFTVLVQSSAATIGMAIALGFSGVLSLEAAIPLVLGANIGTTVTALLAGFNSSNINGKRIGVAHLMVKIVGVAAVMPFLSHMAAWMERADNWIHGFVPFIKAGVTGAIVLTHLLFNLSLAVLFLPLLPLGVWFICKLVPEDQRLQAFGPKYLDPKALNTPPLAFAQAKQEILRVADITFDLYRDLLRMFDSQGDAEDAIRDVETRDDKIDLLDRQIRFYLAKISQEGLTDSQAEQQMALLAMTSDIESVGDVISKDLALLARKRFDKKVVFSPEGWKELQKLHQTGSENFSYAVSAMTSGDEALIRRVEHQSEGLQHLENQLRQTHLLRLHEKRVESFETSSIHLDILGNLRRIDQYLHHIARQARVV